MKRVDPKVYTEDYYLSDCTGFENWKLSGGKVLEPRLQRIVEELPSVNSKKVLDIGCGRGEMALYCAKQGAKSVTGIDYSKVAIKLANEAKKHYEKGIRDKVNFKVGDGKDLKFKDKSIDAVLLTEVLEHIYPDEQRVMFKEIHRVLKGDGFVFIHTAPSKWFNDFTYKFWCYPISSVLVFLNNLITGNKYTNITKPVEIRTKSHKIMHVNEPDYFSLKKLIKDSGFEGKIRSTNITIAKPNIGWKDKIFNSVVYLIPLSNYFPFNVLWGNDFYAVLKK
jgi:ubiquinone/menaquinone biosynthesis C-methylase UbiE